MLGDQRWRFPMRSIKNLVTALVVSVCAISVAKEAFQKIHIADLEKMMQEGVQVYDANVEGTRRNVGLIHGAHALLSSDNFGPSELPSDKNAPLVFYCANTMCTASHEAAKRALSLGYKHVMVMVDGVYGWRKAGNRLDPYQPAKAKEFTPKEAKNLLDQQQATSSMCARRRAP